MGVADRSREASRGSKKKVGHGVAAKIVSEVDESAVTAGFGAVGLPPQHLEARSQGAASPHMPQAPGVAKQVSSAIERDSGAGAEVREHTGDLHIRTGVVGFGHEHRPDAVEAHGEISDRRRAPGAIPGEAGHVRLRAGVGVLSGDELKRIDTLRGQGHSGG